MIEYLLFVLIVIGLLIASKRAVRREERSGRKRKPYQRWGGYGTYDDWNDPGK